MNKGAIRHTNKKILAAAAANNTPTAQKITYCQYNTVIPFNKNS